ncbi:hypothetical protein [Lewinella sp. W8]|uniref:hypothetical protein n=1 Tax=Lewinella sp. W8 TaxID=2528208 RepID=UPI001067CDA7|nr:hypothetical protein [Lewinella sp. W8]MTB53178.1 hypothetical protein [Lewinella sp. W8]
MAYLFLTQRFSSSTGVAHRRLSHLAREKSREAEVFVIHPGKVEENYPPSIHLCGIEATDFRGLILHDPRGMIAADQKSRPLVRHLLRLRQAFPFLYLTDDGGPIYRRRAYDQACKWVEAHGIRTVFSSFRPWSDHLVARRLKRRYPQLRWIADFRDLPVDPVRQDVWWPALQRWWGKRMIAAADEVWVVSSGQAAQLRGWHPRIEVHRNALLELPPERTAPRTATFDIVYTGSLYPGLQTITPLVGAINRLVEQKEVEASDLRLVYRGKDAAAWTEWTSGVPSGVLCDTADIIAPASAQKMQRSAQVLLLLNWAAPGYYGVLTAKLWDYLATGRPILALVNGPADPELADIVHGASAGAVFATAEQRKLEDWLREAYRTWKHGGSLPWTVDREALRRFR